MGEEEVKKSGEIPVTRQYYKTGIWISTYLSANPVSPILLYSVHLLLKMMFSFHCSTSKPHLYYEKSSSFKITE